MKTDKLNSFINSRRQNKTAGRNRLLPYKTEIEYLYNNGMSYKDIAAYLKLEEGVEIAANTVGVFCRKHFSVDSSKTNQNVQSYNLQKSTDELNQVANAEVKEDTDKRPTEQTSSEAPTFTDKNPSQSKTTEDEEVPAHKRMPDWFNVPGINSIDDLR